MPASINEVARICGVSTATVSRIFNNKDNVSPATRDRVLKAAQKLGYSPRVATRKDCAAILVESMGSLGCGGYSYRLLAALMHTLTIKGMRGEIIEAERLGLLGEGFYCGAVSMLYDAAVLAKLPLGKDFPLAVINEKSDIGTEVMSDDLQGMRLALEHLKSGGHNRVCLLYRQAYHSGLIADNSREYRRIAFEKATEELGIAGYLQPWKSEGPVELVAKALKHGCTALIAASEGLGTQVMYALHLLGKAVPDDISLIGFEEEGVSEFLLPPQTTLQQDFRALAASAVEVIIGGSNAHSQILIPYNFIERESVGASGAN